MWDRERKTWAILFLGNVLLNTVIASPIYVPQFIPGSTGRNIRHLPCVSRRTGETGVCMFAFTCAKANGTHLGTCIDRFYFGSCCKIDEEPDIFPQDNSIDDGPPARPFVTTHGPIESNDIPEYFSRPKPINEKKPSETYSTEETTSSYTTQSIRTQATTIKETTKLVTKKPVPTTIETTTQPVRLSTFQTVQNSSKEDSTTKNPPGITTGAVQTSQKPSSTIMEITSTANKSSTSSLSVANRPTTLEIVTRPSYTTQSVPQTTKPITKKPIHSSTTHKPTHYSSTHKPIHSTVHRPTDITTTPKPLQFTTDRTSETTTSKTVITTTQRVTPITRFPPRNATTARPVAHATTTTRKPITSTKKPVTSTSTRRPTITTKKPSTPAKRPTTASKPSVTSSFGTSPSTTTTKPILTSVKHQPTIATSTESIPLSTEAKPASISSTEAVVAQKFTTIATTKPSQKIKPTTIRTTSKPPTTVPRPKPPKINATTSNLVLKPEYTTTTEKTGLLTSINVSTVVVTKPRPTVESTSPTKPLSKPTGKPSSTTLATILSSTVTDTSFVTLSSTDTPTATLAYVPSTKVPVINQTLEDISHTTYSPGLVTWTSSSDDTTTKTPEISSTTITQLDQTESEWTPITTPDGWIMIQSPTTKKPQIVEETTDKPNTESTLQSTTSVKPTTETSTEHVTKKPTILTTLSSIASVTIDTELPVPMETLNMSDYKQVCGRRLFPESRIVGGNRSSFGKWPWQISLRQWRTSTYLHKCGAALLNENWAITAAHCVENVPPSDLLLRIGEHDLANEDEPYGYQERRVQIVASHPQFDPRTFEYDLALLRFYEPLLPFQPNVLPICLPDDDESYVGRTAFVTGWGRLYDEGPLPSTLQEVAVPVINNTMCEAMYRNAGYIEHIPHIFICAGWRNGGFDSCEGDSGGPMVIQRARDKRWILAGVISWGIGCAVPNQPGVYTRISEFREWINQILQF
ncbi:PREDICTED: serine proteinase stubble [Eufriesea mexicana]|uniref:serine proteinase stubble n=1 Tax=Eufriesea mexicana TaxID=516756 RepID=UPI00083BE96D|nr:PREDICTED: serine proteinase stubble [Eufriesea mexicana]